MQYFDWANNTTVHPVGLSLLVACVIAVMLVRRKSAILPLTIMLVAIPSVQRIVIATVDFSFLRILVIATLFRSLIKGEHRGLFKEYPDIIIILWMIWGIVAYALLHGNFGALLTRSGYMLDTVGAYLIGRVYVRSTTDIVRLIKWMGALSVPAVIFFVYERMSGQNVFSIFGGVPFHTELREGRLRCQGPFVHPIMAGVFWASLVPWLGAMFKAQFMTKKQLFLFGFSILGIVVTTASSTPVMTVIFGVIALFLYYIRRYMSAIRWGAVIVFLGLALVMKAPVWHLIARIDVVGGSTGWHRYHLINEFFLHFSEWWLVGSRSTGHWGYGLEDVTNQFVLEGVRGGIVGLGLYSLFLVLVFLKVGVAVRVAKSSTERWMAWGVGAALFMHMMTFLAVSYFGQMLVAYYLFLGASVSVLGRIVLDGKFRRISVK